MPGMTAWLASKLDKITADFRQGHGNAVIYESQFLCYLECYVAAREGDPAEVWKKYEASAKEASPEGGQVLAHSYRIKNRDELADWLVTFRRSFEGPRKKTVSALNTKPQKQRAQKKSKPRSEPDGDILQMFGDFNEEG